MAIYSVGRKRVILALLLTTALLLTLDLRGFTMRLAPSGLDCNSSKTHALGFFRRFRFGSTSFR